MIKIVDCPTEGIPQEVEQLQKRLSVTEGLVSSKSSALTEKVFGKPLTPPEVTSTIIGEIQESGDKAIDKYCNALDGTNFSKNSIMLPTEMKKTISQIDPDLITSINEAKKNILRYQKHICYKEPVPLKDNDGVELGIKVTPMERVGIYIPGGIGGETPLISSILMTALPAKAAGVKEIIMCTPPRKDGTILPALAAAASIAGVSMIAKVGGIQAIAAMALGTETVPKVDKIVGPGNLFVTLAKQKLYGHVDIDFFAGPSEILIIADDSANPDFVAMDLFSQAEHFPGSAILITDSAQLAKAVNTSVEKLLPTLSRAEEIAESIASNCLIITVPSIERAVKLSNRFAPEHLELVTKDNKKTLAGIKNAGAIFIGNYTPVASGDYFAGPSHVLPTGGTPRFFSGLTANDFIKTSSLISFTKEGLRKAQPHVNRLAKTEGLTAHAESLNIRLKD